MTREQFDQAVTTGYDRLVRFAGKYLHDDDVEGPGDMVNAVLLRFRVNKLDAFNWVGQAEFESAVRAYLALAIKDYRARTRTFFDRFERDPIPELESIPDTRPDPLAVLLQHEQASEQPDALSEALASLNETDRYLVMAITAGFTQREVGVTLGLTQQRVAQRYERALARLRALLIPRGRTQAVASGASR